MPDLEKQITEWRRQMLAAGIKAPMPLDELESHLRENVEQQMRLGSEAQQAFEIAVQQMGQPDAIKTEFVKVDLLHSQKIAGFRPYMIVINFLAALLTGPEAVTQLLTFIGLQMLCEAIIWCVRFSRNNAKKPVKAEH